MSLGVQDKKKVGVLNNKKICCLCLSSLYVHGKRRAAKKASRAWMSLGVQDKKKVGVYRSLFVFVEFMRMWSVVFLEG